MRKIFCLLMVLAILTGCAAQAASAPQGYEDMEPAALSEMLAGASADIVVVDVREPDEYAAGHVPDAINVPLGELPGKLAELDKDQPLAVICKTGRRSERAATELHEQGFTKLYNVLGGTMGWQEAGLETSTEP